MTEILFLGTGAADWNLNNKGDFFRRNSAALIDRNLMLDCGAHIFDFAESEGKEHLYNGVENILITHFHGDHISKDSVLKLAEKRKIRLGCAKKVADYIGENENIEFVILSPFSEVEMGKYKIIPVLANHSIVTNGENHAFHYIIETPEGKKIFYGLDGAWFLRPSWEEMKKHKFDIMIFDCTAGDSDDWRLFEHNTIPMLRMMVKEIGERKMLAENGKLIASHFAKSLHGTHEETENILSEINVLTAYDGLKLDF